jgi:hypothetical protein
VSELRAEDPLGVDVAIYCRDAYPNIEQCYPDARYYYSNCVANLCQADEVCLEDAEDHTLSYFCVPVAADDGQNTASGYGAGVCPDACAAGDPDTVPCGNGNPRTWRQEFETAHCTSWAAGEPLESCIDGSLIWFYDNNCP